jgi:hypothetical protein
MIPFAFFVTVFFFFLVFSTRVQEATVHTVRI